MGKGFICVSLYLPPDKCCQQPHDGWYTCTFAKLCVCNAAVCVGMCNSGSSGAHLVQPRYTTEESVRTSNIVWFSVSRYRSDMFISVLVSSTEPSARSKMRLRLYVVHNDQNAGNQMCTLSSGETLLCCFRRRAGMDWNGITALRCGPASDDVAGFSIWACPSRSCRPGSAELLLPLLSASRFGSG